MKTVKYESTGPYVEMLQLALRRSGNDPGAIDGIFGGRTLVSLQAFQKHNSLTPDGIAGEKTWAALLPYLRGYRRYEAQRGDSFYKLARRFGSTPEAISAANPGVSSKNIPVGQLLVIPFGFEIVPRGISYTYELSELVIDGLKARYPFVRGGKIGNSVMGKRISYLRIGNGPTEIFYNGAHHANEWITAPVLAAFAEEYAAALLKKGEICGKNAQSLFSRTTLFLAPMIDPDGVDLVTGALTSGRFYDRALEISGNYSDI
ncbi:MAG: peptidoglycan-binding protein, partial [Oscillospiraceae bacterium]|nr:peptidoglycan-binding protein [Oscillospiraceae bacterium]